MPFDGQLYLLGASIALNLGEYRRARAWLLEAQRHDSQNWLTPFALGLAEGEEGRYAQASARLRRARLLNPLESAIQTALSRLRERRPLSFAEAQTLLAPHIVTPGS
jgi:tetratricopeptide (TPR) repeat protein